jgi:carbonic anhydrase
MLRDNRDYMKHGPKFFEAFAKAQKPRVTVVTCSDSRVQSAAWDNTPENDNFTIRNIGNLLTTSHGSVEYGVEHLNTSVLLIVGHTGCGAIKAAMGDKAGLSAPIRSEIDAIVVPKELQGDSSDSAWTAAVIANVHDQVRHGLEAFASFVNEGRLTIVGAVFDFRNDLGKGPGRLTIVDVNGNSEKERLDAFVSAVSGSEGAPSNKPTNETTESAAPSPATGASLEAITKQLEKLGEQESKKPVNR